MEGKDEAKMGIYFTVVRQWLVYGSICIDSFLDVLLFQKGLFCLFVLDDKTARPWHIISERRLSRNKVLTSKKDEERSQHRS